MSLQLLKFLLNYNTYTKYSDSIKTVYKDNKELNILFTYLDKLHDRYKKDPNFKKLVVDGKTGRNSKTEDAITRYQNEKGLAADGQLGPETTQAMRKDGLDKFERRYKLFGLF